MVVLSLSGGGLRGFVGVCVCVGAAKAASVASSPTGRSARLASKKSLEPHGMCMAKFGV